MVRAAKTDTPTLHGHYDGDLTLDTHRHPGGDRVHGHPDKESLGRVIGAQEYVPPDKLDVAQEGVAAVQKEADRTKRVGGLTDPDAPTIEISRVDPDAQAADLIRQAAALGSSNGLDQDFQQLTAIVERAEADRQDAVIRKHEGHTLVDLFSVVKKAKKQADNRQQVDPALIREGLALWSNWANQRGALKDDGS